MPRRAPRSRRLHAPWGKNVADFQRVNAKGCNYPRASKCPSFCLDTTGSWLENGDVFEVVPKVAWLHPGHFSFQPCYAKPPFNWLQKISPTASGQLPRPRQTIFPSAYARSLLSNQESMSHRRHRRVRPIRTLFGSSRFLSMWSSVRSEILSIRASSLAVRSSVV